MKIEAPKSSSINALHQKAAKNIAPGFNIPMQETAQAQTNRAANSSTTIANLGSLLALQSIPQEAFEKRKRATKRAENILDLLEDLKVATLEGQVTPSHLMQLRNAIKGRESVDNDPALQGVLDDIELRAEVELAKLERAI